MNAAAKIKKIRAAKELPGKIIVKARLISLENSLNLVRDFDEFLQKIFGGVTGQRAASFTQVDRKQNQSGELRGKRFCGGHANFRAGMRENRARGFARDHGAENVTDRER